MYFYLASKHCHLAGTSHGVIIVEDDNALWLPPENGCSEVGAVLQKATQTIMVRVAAIACHACMYVA
jgi:hypothetical protein